MYPNDTRLQWTSFVENSTCHTMTLLEKMVEFGSNALEIYFELQPSLALYWHQNGLFDTDMPDSCPVILLNKNGYYIPIGHETLKLLDYGREQCEESKDYKLEFIET